MNFRPYRSKIFVSLLLLLIFISQSAITAQVFDRDEFENQGGRYYSFFTPGEATVRVNVVGAIGAAGIWDVGVSVDLGMLVALAGGPTAQVASRNEGSSVSFSEGTVKLYRQTGGRRDLIYEAPLDRMLQEMDLYPPLQDGDAILLETITTSKNKLTWRDAILLLNTVISTAVLIDNLRNR
jgi:hypothetical protein